MSGKRRYSDVFRSRCPLHGAIGIADFLIAASALVTGCELATLNVRHFPMIDDLEAPFAV